MIKRKRKIKRTKVLGKINKYHNFTNIKKNKNKSRNYLYIKLICIIVFIIFLIYESKLNLTNIKDQIIYENKYNDFELIKNRFNKDSFVFHYLEKITILNHTFNKNNMKLKKKKNNIHITVSFNNDYVYKLIVSMESVLSNCNKQKTFITYHVLCAPDVTENSLIILKSFMKRYSLNLEMIFYNMGNNFKSFKNCRLSQSTFYRLLLPIFINSDRILHLDGDTLVYKDLSEVFQMDFNDNYIYGSLDYLSYDVDYLGINSNKYINAGVILMNLEKIRNDKKYYDLINITTKVELKLFDQAAINYVLYPKIGQLPFKFNVFTFYDQSDINRYIKSLRQNVNVTQIEEALYDPMIMHSVGGPKFWFKHSKRFDCNKKKDCSCNNYNCIWIYYAKKTDYYQEIISHI